MDKEKLLKKYILMFSLQTICACTFWFLFLIRKIVKVETIYMPFFVMITAFISIWIDKNSLAVMPQIISIHDTVEKLNRQIGLLAVATAVLLVVSGVIIVKSDSVLARLIASFSWMLVNFIRLTQRKIDYIKNKPEGMNF